MLTLGAASTPHHCSSETSAPKQQQQQCAPPQVLVDPASESVAVMHDAAGHPSEIAIAVDSCEPVVATAHAPLVSATLVPGAAGAAAPAEVTAVLRQPSTIAHGPEPPLRAPLAAAGLSMLAPPETFLGLPPSEPRGPDADVDGNAGEGGSSAHSTRAKPCNAEQAAALQGTVRYVRDAHGAGISLQRMPRSDLSPAPSVYALGMATCAPSIWAAVPYSS